MTSHVDNRLILLASREELHRVWGRFDRARPGLSTNQLMAIVAVLALASIAFVLWRLLKSRASRTFSSDSSARLFRDLCAAHGIKRSGRRLLRQLAEARGAIDPAVLFVEPQHFDTRNLPPELKESASELRTLNETLFG